MAAAAAATLLQKSLPDIVRGIREHKKNEKEYIQKCISDIKDELKQRDFGVKVIAVQKMTYLHMIGFDMEYGAFQIIEVMSRNEDFGHKRIGYLACAQCFHREIEVLPLVTNLLKKDLLSPNQYEAGLALSCLSNICTPDLARDLVADVANLLTSGRAYIRKKTLLTLFKIFLQFPDALKASFPRIKEKLDDSDPSVVAATVNVLCELARRNPGNYLGMAPVFFKLLTSLHNNWTLIKIVKLFGALVPLEQRLGKKLNEPLANIINTTPAKSLLYECCSTVVHGMHKQPSLLRLGVEKLKQFVEDPDQNLKYLGLLGLSRVMVTSPKMLVDLRDTVIDCLGDEDPTIRMRALELAAGLVTKKNLHQTVAKIIEQLAKRVDDEEFSNTLVKHVVETCRQQDYAFITSFEWYLRVLMELAQAKINRFKHGDLLEEEFLRVATRVRGVRPFAVKCMTTMLGNPNVYQRAADGRSNIARILRSAAYICSEHPLWVGRKADLVRHMVRRRVLVCDADVQTAMVQAVLKLYLYVIDPPDEEEEDDDDGGPRKPPPSDPSTADEVYEYVFPTTSGDGAAAPGEAEEEDEADGIDIFLASCHVDVQEHATSVRLLIKACRQLREDGHDVPFRMMCSDPLRPVAPGAQQHVAPPSGVDLDAQIIDYQPPSSDESFCEDTEGEPEQPSSPGSASSGSSTDSRRGKRRRKESRADERRRRKQEMDRKRHDPHYLPYAGEEPSAEPPGAKSDDDLPAVQELPGSIADELGSVNLGIGGFKEKKARREKAGTRRALVTEFEAPEGYSSPVRASARAEEPADAKSPEAGEDVWAALNQDLTGPAAELPTVKPYERKTAEDFERREGRDRDRRRRRRREEASESDGDYSRLVDGDGGGKGKKKKKGKKGDRRGDGGSDGDSEGRGDAKPKKRKKEKAEPAIDPDGPEAKALKKRLKRWLADVPIGGKAGSSSKRKFDVAPLVEFAIRKGMVGAEPEEIYKASVEEKEKGAEAPTPVEPAAAVASPVQRKEKEPRRPPAAAAADVAVSAVWRSATRSKRGDGCVYLDLDLRVSNTGRSSLRNVRIALARDSAAVLDCGDGYLMSKDAITSDSSKAPLKLSKEGSLTIPVSLEFSKAVTSAVALSFKVSYSAKDRDAREVVPLTVPISAFMAQVKRSSIDSSAFADTMRDMNGSGCGSSKCDLSVPSIADAFSAVTSTLRLQKVEVFDSCASMHGTHLTPEGKQHVCVLAKALGPERLVLEFKSASQDLAGALAAEASTLFGAAAAPKGPERAGGSLDFLDMS
eukprot:TRINITY_DN7764_c3_g1_i2.p1 TRINITY_DN7764_c3_g1~~TRINITY_DN7764_c3_g1_i2.p1  ORF type:complete len:1286 (+),score=583.90 TRINITY_DN7764_c3_g1_i2:117-3974(+)